jgi:antitoxin HigA-1
MDKPGFDYHALRGPRRVTYATHVSGPWCITFERDDVDTVRSILSGITEEVAMAEYAAGRPFPGRQPTHPGELLRADVLPALGLSVTVAAAKLGISRQTLHGILNGKHAVTPEMAARLGKLCGDGAGIWLRMQQAHDLWRVERDMAAELARIPTLRAA